MNMHPGTTPWRLSFATLACLAWYAHVSVAQQASLASVALPTGTTTVQQMQQPDGAAKARPAHPAAKVKREEPSVGELLDPNTVQPGGFVDFLYFPKGRRPNRPSPMVGGC
ncbi:MAG: hypothetical protein JNL43_04510 [Flavobacteriales bacterium]|nr:hypothetical protein [Flavobacteriales bacterium]